jgi:glycogen(starch) synthase
MKILISAHVFAPSVGGVQDLALLLATGLAANGHDVRVVTQTPGGNDDYRFEVIRRPGPLTLARLVGWSDLYYHCHLSLRSAWPLLFVRRPWVVTHSNWFMEPDGTVTWKDRLKRAALRFAHGIAVSRAIAGHLTTPSVVIPPAYPDDVFRLLPDIARDQCLVFVGRLVSDKGADLLLEALSILKKRGITERLTIVGTGPEEETLKATAIRLGVGASVDFAGYVSGQELAVLLNRHRIMVLPSRWNEPYPIVALDGIACGCVVVGSEGGGLADAIASCGLTFRNGDALELSQVLEHLILHPESHEHFRANAASHLRCHTRDAIVGAYETVFEGAFQRAANAIR